MSRRSLLAFAVCGVLVSVAAVARAGDADTAVTIQRMDALYAERDKHGAIPDCVALGEQCIADDPQNYEIQWRMARAYFWVAYTQPARVSKKALAAKALEWAERARTSAPDRVEGHYFYAVALGEYASTVGIMQAIVDGVAGKVEDEAERAYQIDRDFSHGAPGTVLGRFYFLLPWPKQDLKKSRRYLEEVAARHPRALLAREYLAETYYELDEPESARQQLNFVLTNQPAPGTELDRPDAKQLARESMQRWFADEDD